MNSVERYKQAKHPLDVIEDVREYAEEGLSFAEIEERAGGGEWERLKWAGMYSHGVQDGYFMMRTKVPGGKLTPEQADAAEGVDRLDRAALEAALGWDQTAWPDFRLYHPIFASAPGAAIRGAALPRSAVAAAVEEGAASVLSAAGAAYLRPVGAGEQARRETLQQEAHCGALPADLLPGMVEAQRLRDAAFARAVVSALDETGGPVVLITGNGHARTDWGVPAVLGHARPEIEVFSLGQVEGVAAAQTGPYDEIVPAPAVDRPDPCAAFR